MAIIFPECNYQEALDEANICKLGDHHKHICSKLLKDIKVNADHMLHSLLPTKDQSAYSMRNKRVFTLPKFKTSRYGNFFIIKMNKLANIQM